MLHTRARDTLNFREIRALLLQPLQYEVDSLKKQCYRRKHFALAGVCEHTLLDAILGAKVCVKVDLCFLQKLEVGSNNDSCVPRGQRSVVG